MKKYVALMALALVTASSAGAQQQWRDELLEDLVNIRDGKMVIEAYSLDRISLAQYEPVEFQVKLYSEVPATGVISRDNFVALSAVLAITVLQLALAEAFDVPASEFLAAYDSKDLDQPIGRPDLEINIYMTAEGFQLEFIDTTTGQTSRVTQTWDKVVGSGN